MSGPVVGYDSAVLAGSQRQQADVGVSRAQLAHELAAVAVTPGMFGDVPAARLFTDRLTGVRNGQLRDVEAEARRDELGVRSARTTELSTELTAGTTQVARSVTGPSIIPAQRS